MKQDFFLDVFLRKAVKDNRGCKLSGPQGPSTSLKWVKRAQWKYMHMHCVSGEGCATLDRARSFKGQMVHNASWLLLYRKVGPELRDHLAFQKKTHIKIYETNWHVLVFKTKSGTSKTCLKGTCLIDQKRRLLWQQVSKEPGKKRRNQDTSKRWHFFLWGR